MKVLHTEVSLHFWFCFALFFLCCFLDFLHFDNFLPICHTFRRMGRKIVGKWFFTLQVKWGAAHPQAMPNLTHKEAAFHASIETWKNVFILLMKTFLWEWMTVKLFPLILLDMPLENVPSCPAADFPFLSWLWQRLEKLLKKCLDLATGASSTSLSVGSGSIPERHA